MPLARYRLLQRVTGIFGLLLIAVTWRLWMPQDVFPQIPLFESVGDWPAPLDYGALAAAVVGLAAIVSLAPSQRGAWLRWLCPLGFGLAIVLDQHRLQPWVYQISALAIIFSLCEAHRGLQWIRVLTIGIYGWSAVGKLDFQFTHTVGAQMIDAMLGLVGIAAERMASETIRAAALALPLGEAVVALLLAWPRLRRAGVLLAVALHLSLIVILGPLGLDHQPGVLIWNAFFAIQAVVLFWPRAIRHPAADEERDMTTAGPLQLSSAVTLWMVVAMLVLPAVERVGLFDHWLSWALYAPHSSRATVYVTRDAVERLPPSLVALIEEEAGGEGQAAEEQWNAGFWVRVPIDRWSLETLRVPIYPQDRFQLGVALQLSRDASLDREIRVILRSASNRFSGQRKAETLTGRPELLKAAEEFFFSTKPRAG